MFSKVSNLISNNVFFVSRQKTMLKRRKITSKKQKVAKKKFLEQNPHASYTNELKILQIQKQLDRKVNKNHHLNELMDELFYPDVRYANEKLLQQNLLNLANNPQQALPGRSNHPNNPNPPSQPQHLHKDQQHQYQEQPQIDPLVQQIYLCQIPSQLFQLYLKNSPLFTQHHLILYLDRLGYYFINRSVIQDRITYKWKQSLEKMKFTDVERKKKRRCPYVFIEQEELIRDEQWNKVVKDINKKIILTTEHIANQQQPSLQQQQPSVTDDNQLMQQQQQQQLQHQQQSSQQHHIDPSFYSLQNNCQLALKIHQVANYLPHQLFESILKKTLAILQLDNNSSDNKHEQQSAKSHEQQQHSQRLPLFNHQQKVKLLRVLALKAMTKSTMTKAVYIDSIELSQKQEQKVVAIGKKLCEDIMNSAQCSAQDVGVVVTSHRGQLKFLNSMLLDLCKPKILKYLSSTRLQRSIDYLQVYWQTATTKDATFIQLLVFDIYRKLPYSTSKPHLFTLLHMIKDSRVYFKQSKITVSVAEIYPRVVETVTTQYLNKGQLMHEEIKAFVMSVYDNYPVYKSQQGLSNILQMISTAIVKTAQGFKLQQITQLLFRTSVMGHRSRVFSKFVFQRYLKEYRRLMRQYKQTRIQLIDDKSSSLSLKKKSSSMGQGQEQDVSEGELPSMNEVVLEESLVMMLWSLVVSFNNNNNNTQQQQQASMMLPLSDMLQIYPVHVRSQDPMIDDLINDLNTHLQDLNYFPRIKNKQIYETKIKDNRRRSLKAVALLLKTNTCQSYSYHYSETLATEVLQKLQDGNEHITAQLHDRLVLFLIRYYVVKEKIQFAADVKLPDRWNDAVEGVFVHRASTAYQVKKEFLQYMGKSCSQQKSSSNRDGNLSIGQRIVALIQKQAAASHNVPFNKQTPTSPARGYKLYQLL